MLSGFTIDIYNSNGGLLLHNITGEFELDVSDIDSITFVCKGSSLSEDASPCVFKDAVFYVKN